MRTTLPVVLVLTALGAAGAQTPEQDACSLDVPNSRTHYSMPQFTSRDAWLARASFLRKQILASAGLLPMPEKRPIHAEVFDRIERSGYTIEKVLLGTWPGFYLGADLYRPSGKRGSFPAVMSPHGHWHYGRLENQQLVSVSGRCINLVPQGFVVSTYDMFGYNDTYQLPHHWGSRQQDLWNINPLGVHFWDSIHAVDFVSSLASVGVGRIAATDASSGDTQTFTLRAVDDRIKAAASVNMILAEMQGGVCGRAANLRVGGNNETSNMVITTLMAPRPLLMILASNWTHNTRCEECPAVRSIYRLFETEENVEGAHLVQVHNRESREGMDTFFGAGLLGTKGQIAERPFTSEHPKDLLGLFGSLRPAGAILSLDPGVAPHRHRRRTHEPLLRSGNTESGDFQAAAVVDT